MLARHFTVTTYILKDEKTLLIFHPKHQKWLPPGGHLEPGETPPEGAKREVLEETGLEIEFIPQENLWVNCWNAVSIERPYLSLLENVPEQGSEAPHQHIDLIYIARPIGGEEHAHLIKKRVLRWFTLEEVSHLKKDKEIFGDTQQVISHLYSFSGMKIYKHL